MSINTYRFPRPIGKQAIQVTEISRAAFKEIGTKFLPLPPDPWFVRGPRGGVYMATGERERMVDETGGDRWHMNIVAVVDRSEGTKYVRPGTKLYRQATADV